MYSMQTARCCKTYKVSTSRRLVMQVRQTSSQKPPLQPNNFMSPWPRLGSSHCAFLQGSTANCRSCLTACRAACSWLSSSLENHNQVRCLATCESNFGKGRWTKKRTFAFESSVKTYEECMGQCFRGLSFPRGRCRPGRKPRTQILWDKVYVVF